jgi:DNA mismatch endonuclease (patch repair protein)
LPRTNIDYWHTKLARTVRRDADHIRQLNSLGWKALIVWECEIPRPDLPKRLTSFLS